MAKMTQKAIVDAFMEILEERPIDKITVLNVCEASGVSRSTFYYHYHDLYDLLETLLHADAERVVASCLVGDSWSSIVEKMSLFVGQNRKAVYHLYKGLNHEALESYLFEVGIAVAECMTRAEAAKYANVTEAQIEHVIRVFSSTLVGLTFGWLHHGLDDSFSVHFSDIETILKGLASAFFERPAEA